MVQLKPFVVLFLGTVAAFPREVYEVHQVIEERKIDQALCKPVSAVIKVLRVVNSATAFCSSFLSISTVTVKSTTTSVTTTTSTITDRTTTTVVGGDAGTVTVTAAEVTATAFTTITSLTQICPTVLKREAATAASEPTLVAINAKRAEEPVKRAAVTKKIVLDCSKAPLALKVFGCPLVSTACECLSIPTPTTTSVVTATSVSTVTAKATVTDTANIAATTTSTPTATTVSTVTVVQPTCPCTFDKPNLCGTTCVSLADDPNNCGRCGNTCASRDCRGGQCRPLTTCPQAGQCGNSIMCGGAGCYCRQTVSNGALCLMGSACSPACSEDADCGVGGFCALNTCCGGGVCDYLNDICGNPRAPKFMFRKRSLQTRDKTTQDHVGTDH
ncbi:hypothetical protein BU24DRAFT_466747 [Aaosphaeria arxii CBS 175.79]|uniref:IGFBP N-terminal domain-containing protein n=1 Tax=Aaosphaeria arxii CBS 175.79 TaxID=1450172 RepID=A0A6A5XD11_9PLEO|nr:uncharacterized protein BU24DRAFT_466747 [Aaosphaeria arxii CBS 175.79]KAF2011005.1 hypothetical protein BU24DRAFT_466747 [Aaosphaeria arxii CBS 175.79]